MITRSRLSVILFLSFSSAASVALSADAKLLSNVHSQTDLNALIASTSDAPLKKALQENAATILAAVEARPHIEIVATTVEGAKGKLERINSTPAALKQAAGTDLALFDTLKAIDLSIPNAGPHDARKVDPFDAAFFEHLSHIQSLESLYIIQTKCNDQWIAPLGKLANLKSLRFVNNGKLTDAGLENLAGLKSMESFGYIGTSMLGHAFAKFDGWTNLKTCSFRGSSIDDEGLRLICEKFPNLENISLAHAKFTDAGAVHLAKLTKLKGLELGTKNATAATLAHVQKLPLEYLQLGEGFENGEAVRAIAGLASLHRLTLTNAKDLKEEDLQVLAGMKQLESLELNNVPEDKLELLKPMTFLKSLRLVKRPQAYSAEAQAKLKAMLPKTAMKFE
jgi:hypothetical protein